MTEITRAEFDEFRREMGNIRQTVAHHETQYEVINTKLTAILWLLGAVGSAVITMAVKTLFGGTV